MQIENIDIKSYYYFSDTIYDMDGVVHTKQLKSLSVVQSKIGSYGIKINNGKEYSTGSGGIFIAPSLVTQKIIHHNNPKTDNFKMRFILIDIIINHKYRPDDIFDFPVIPDRSATDKIDRDFDFLDKANSVCDKMSGIYQIIKHLLETAHEKSVVRNERLYVLTEFISRNYMKNITVHDMADVMNMSESNLYAVFKKAFGVSLVKYLNDYRLSAASEQLLQSNDSISSIAESVGISDQFYFSKLFKSKYSMSPRQYRKATETV